MCNKPPVRQQYEWHKIFKAFTKSWHTMTNATRVRIVLTLFLLFLPLSAVTAGLDRQPIVEALGWMRGAPKDLTQFDYIMTARVRLLFFWVGKDDVGGGYIRRGISSADPRQELFQVLFGSDPAKTPKAINRWGAGTEVLWHKAAVAREAKTDDVVASAFFGFMKSSKGKSASEMQEELKKEKEQSAHQFTGILSRVETGHAVSLVVPFESNQDFTLHQYPEAEPLMFERLGASDRPIRSWQAPGGCARASEFLGTVAEMLDEAREKGVSPAPLCYVYDAQENTLSVEHTEKIAKLEVKLTATKGAPPIAETSYEDLQQVDFVSTHKITGKRVYFTIFIGTRGALRGVPVQIRYQPNWWFQVVLNLKQPDRQPGQTLAR
jgi:hypothetical protein